MECNKDEAVRAREMAEKKLAAQDYRGALKFLQKAQQLFPALENTAQLFSVIEVHIASQSKINGTEMDWYGILQVDSKSDEVLIKKQYRKLALLLHPDKNKSMGAESAFKLVGEASQILLDKQKRSIYDVKRNQVARPSKVTQPRGQSQHSNVRSYVPAHSMVFTTVCPSCNMPFQLPRHYVNAQINCPLCTHPLQAREVYIGHTNGTYGLHTWPPQHPLQQPAFGHNPFQPFGPQFFRPSISTSNPSKPTASATQPVPAAQPTQPQTDDMKQKESAEKVGVEHKNKRKRREDEKNSEKEAQIREREQRKKVKADEALERIMKKQMEKAEKEVAQKEQAKKRRVRKHMSDSSDDDEVSDHSLEDLPQGLENPGDSKGGPRRRSSRPRRNVTYVVDMSDDEDDFQGTQRNVSEDGKSTKEARMNPDRKNEATSPSNHEDQKNCEDANDKKPVELGKKTASVEDTEIGKPKTSGHVEVNEEEEEVKSNFNVPDADFYNFDKDREAKDVATGQIWASYDDKDGLPRYYFRVKEVRSRDPFKVRICWLEPENISEYQAEMNDLGFSASCCNRFRSGKSQVFDSVNAFSHIVKWKKGPSNKTIQIYPNAGDVWAIFKNWEPSLKSLKKRTIVYDMVEVLTDFSEESGVQVACLEKLGGFKALFKRTEGVFNILPSELCRFSHQIPAHMLKGDEGPTVPPGCWELDPASMPLDLFIC